MKSEDPTTEQFPDDPDTRATCQKAQDLANALLELNAQISVVKGARTDYQEDKKAYDQAMSEFEAEHEGLITQMQYERKAVDEAETRLRDLTLAAYALDPANKKPAPGVGIKVVKKVILDDRRKAYEWAMEHRTCLTLDLGSFEALVKTSPVESFPDWVHLKEEPQATISRDLGGA